MPENQNEARMYGNYGMGIISSLTKIIQFDYL